MNRHVDICIVVMALAWCVACVAMVLMGSGCKVYLPPCEPGETERAHPGGGVSVKLSELDTDGGEP